MHFKNFDFFANVKNVAELQIQEPELPVELGGPGQRAMPGQGTT